MNFLTFFFITFSLPKYYILIILNTLFLFFRNFKNLNYFINKKEIFYSILIFILMYFFFNQYDFNIINKIGWPILCAMFYSSIILNKNIFNKKNYVAFFKILFFGSLLYIILSFTISFLVEYPILRNGLIHPHKGFYMIFREFYYDEDFTYSQKIYQRVNIAFLYLKIYTCVFAIVSISLLKDSKHSIYVIFLPILFIIGLSYGSRSFAFFFIISNISILLLNRNTINFIIVLINVLILIFNINFFKNDSTSNYYLKLFKLDNEKIEIINNQISDNELNYSLFDINSFNSTRDRIPKDLVEIKQSRLTDNVMGFKAILSLKSKDELKDFFEKRNPDSYFLKQNFFHNTYLNFFYLGNYLSFLLFIFLNLNFFLNIILGFKKKVNDHNITSLAYLFFSFQYIFLIETPFLTDKSIIFIYILFFCFSQKIKFVSENTNSKFK